MNLGRTSPYRLTPNLLSIGFGTTGVAQAWALAEETVDAPSWPADVLWITAAVFWVVITVSYLGNVIAQGRLGAQMPDPIMGPFTSVLLIVPMLLGIALEPHASTAGRTIFAISLVLTILLGAWLTGLWIRADIDLVQWHPGYFLPTVAGGFIASAGSATLGWTTLGRLMLGYGLVCWFVLGSIMLLRLFTQPMLPPPLLPTIAIEVAPPVVGGNAWFALNHGRLDIVAALFGGYAALMVLVQFALIPVYRKAPFGPAYWAFAFSYAAVFTDAVRWLDIEHVDAQESLTYLLLSIATAALLALLTRTVLGLARGTFLPRAPSPTH